MPSPAATKPDKKADVDQGENPALMEPLVVIPEGFRHRTGLADLAFELAKRSAGFRRSLPSGLASTLADLVWVMNVQRSNA